MTSAVIASPLSLYPGAQFPSGWAGQGLLPPMGAADSEPGAISVNSDVPLSTHRGTDRLPVLRGWVVLAGGMAPGAAEDVPGWTVVWPCRLADLEASLNEIRGCEEAARQAWLDQGVDACGVPAALALERQARVVAWLLDRESALELGWTGDAGSAVQAAHDPGLHRLIAALVHLVPGAVFRLEGGAGQAAQAALCMVADLLALEQTGRTHGRCLARMRKSVLRTLALPLNFPLNSTSAMTSGVAL